MLPHFESKMPLAIERQRGRSGSGLQTVVALGTIGLGAVCYAFLDSRGRVLVASLCGLTICLMAYVTIERLVRQSIALRLFVVSYALQFVALAAIAGLGLPFSPPYHPFQIDASEVPIRAVLAILTAPAGALIAAYLWSFISRLAGHSAASNPAKDVAARRRVYLIIAALLHLLYWPAGLENSGILGYIGRILATGLVCSPFLAGHDSLADRRLRWLWLFTILINAGIGIVAGTRGKALIAAVLFIAGYISAMPRRKRVIASTCAAVAAIPLMQLAGALGVVRDELGRGGLEMVETGRVSEVFERLSHEMFPDEGQTSEAVREHGVSRMLAWTNVVVPMMTPEVVPYRGFDGFLDEAARTFQIASLSGYTPDDLYDAGLWTAPAKDYGFTVNAYTSVEFTLVADGWSRGGVIVALLFSFVAGLVLTVTEVAVHRLHRFGTSVATILALPIAKAAFFDTSVVPLLPMLRGVALYTVCLAIIVMAVESLRQTTHIPRRGAAVSATWGRSRG
jgi:hypothetical protein